VPRLGSACPHSGPAPRAAATGHPWPGAAKRGAGPECGHAEPKRGTEWWGKDLLVTFGAFAKSDPL